VRPCLEEKKEKKKERKHIYKPNKGFREIEVTSIHGSSFFLKKETFLTHYSTKFA
jgi:hypothetical protein